MSEPHIIDLAAHHQATVAALQAAEAELRQAELKVAELRGRLAFIQELSQGVRSGDGVGAHSP